ncbi:MAG: ParB/RepB/Spo0J family partition protein [Syntrophorhabdaceae bacterium]|nr:ParB/RepB/Spo0J family partition protein [Syntrophorhabdaceae bacterium]
MTKKNRMLLELEKSASEFIEKAQVDDVAPLINAEVEFSHIQLKDILIHEQVRSKEAMDQESLKELMDSINEKGVLQPVLVFRASETESHRYVLVAGERRFLASKALNKPHIPARILTKEPVGAEIIEIQLIENLQRKDLNPIDEAQGYLSYYSTCLKDPGVKLDAMASDLYTYTTRPEKLKKDIALIINALEKISGKSIGYIRKLVSLLRLPQEAIAAVRSEALGLTQAIVFAENLSNPRFNDILTRALTNKMTVKAIEAAFKRTAARKAGVAFYKKRISQLSNDVQKNASSISTGFAKQLLQQTEDLIKILKTIIEKA